MLVILLTIVDTKRPFIIFCHTISLFKLKVKNQTGKIFRVENFYGLQSYEVFLSEILACAADNPVSYPCF